MEGKRITAFTDSEEKAAGLDRYMPFLLESKLRQAGSNFAAAPDWSDHFEVDGILITGQNPQSTLSVAKAVITKLNELRIPKHAKELSLNVGLAFFDLFDSL
ncbi:hypothetical protein GCM10008018_53600 [Paenibacillus marchantiophytorum]|uniref:DJ-1/PfpI domain-containing protein n=1 Tax=Paenibacillus marchantiophytorum TaxID=1619310 RepID=A0ABQ1F646_9BACL|nr:hypothetical protein GCM10008018_53600 [Paenibacillus marchantiophytorum]